jgi:HD-GYP domain-containing protein (c-di-GMP phosphodiesterase class II)
MPTLIRQSDCLAVALSKRDAYTEAHCGRVESLCYQLGLRCQLNPDELILLRVSSRLHDIGKIGIPDQILLKPGRLEPDELEIMRSHAELGQDICAKISNKDALKISLFVRHHHEAFDGSGYPDGLSGEKIPLCSRIISLADSYDAMLTTRPYQRARTHEQVLEIMKGECGKKSDPFLFGQFEQLVAHPEYIS